MLIMAKKGTRADEYSVVPSLFDRTPITGRTRYKLTDKYVVPGYSDPLPDIAELVECNDGYWAVIIKGEQMCYRLGPTIIESLKNILLPITQQQ